MPESHADLTDHRAREQLETDISEVVGTAIGLYELSPSEVAKILRECADRVEVDDA